MNRKTKRILEGIRKDARYPSKDLIHVFPSLSKGWSVLPDDRIRAVRVLPTQKEAISFAKKYITSGKIVIHNSDGTTGSSIIIKN